MGELIIRTFRVRGVPYTELGDGWFAREVKNRGGHAAWQVYWGPVGVTGAPTVLRVHEEGGGRVRFQNLADCLTFVEGRRGR